MLIKIPIITIAPLFVLKASQAYLAKTLKDIPKKQRGDRCAILWLNKHINIEIIERELKKYFR